MERDGALTVQAPKDAGTEELTRVVRSREVWIYGKLAEKEVGIYTNGALTCG